MSLDDSPPDFKQDVPDEILLDMLKQEEIDGKVSPTRRYLVTLVSQQAKSVTWLIKHEKEKGQVLDGILTQTKISNGRITKLEDEVLKLKENKLENKADFKQIKEDIKLVVIAQKLAFTKWFWIGLFVFLFGLYSLLVNAEFIKSLPILKSLLGG